ncbi:MAG: hypothetical protein Q9194_007464 [Teloschistes cf. exilis]
MPRALTRLLAKSPESSKYYYRLYYRFRYHFHYCFYYPLEPWNPNCHLYNRLDLYGLRSRQLIFEEQEGRHRVTKSWHWEFGLNTEIQERKLLQPKYPGPETPAVEKTNFYDRFQYRWDTESSALKQLSTKKRRDILSEAGPKGSGPEQERQRDYFFSTPGPRDLLDR